MAIYMEEEREHPKNPRKALLLALLLGPIGMFYATVTWATVMLFMNLIFGVITYGLAILILWPIGANIAYNAVIERNRKLLQEKNCSSRGLLSPARAKSLIGIGRSSKPIQSDDWRPVSGSSSPTLEKRASAGLIWPMAAWFFRTIGTGTLRTIQLKGNSSACATAGGKPKLAHKLTANNNDVIESRLSRLKSLREKDLIDEAEYGEKKKAILDEL
jgi:hypothetical protein